MGTHNHVLRLNDRAFLEVIAIDPAANPPATQRWFGLDDGDNVRAAWEDGRRLRTWVACTHDLAAIASRHGHVLSRRTRASRGDRSWTILLREDGSLPAAGAAPPVIDWGSRGSPAPGMPNLGLTPTSFAKEHPDPASIARLYQDLDLTDAPTVRAGRRLRYRAAIATRSGPRVLT